MVPHGGPQNMYYYVNSSELDHENTKGTILSENSFSH